MLNMKLKELRKIAESKYRLFSLVGSDITEFSPKADNSWISPGVDGGSVYQLNNGKWSYYDWAGKKWHEIAKPPAALVAYTSTVQSQSEKQHAAKPAAPTIKPLVISHENGTVLYDENYVYTVTDKTGSFDWYAKSAPTVVKHFTLKQFGAKKWNDAVIALNSGNVGVKSQQATTPAAETAKPAEPAAAVSSLDPTLVANVRAILMRVQSEALAVSTAQNEKGRVKEIIAGISEEIGQNINATDFLAQLIVARRGQQLSALGLGDIDTKIIPNTNKKEFTFNRPLGKPGVYAQPTSAILQEVNLIYDAFKKYVKSGETEFFKSINHTVTPAQPPAAPATTAPTTSSIKYPAKIIRLASLRRLRVRSEMEAAITGSAMPGRDRVV